MKSHQPESLPGEQDRTQSSVSSESSSSESRETLSSAAVEERALGGDSVEELTNRLPTSELIRIIKGALECGRRNVPFTETDLLRAMTIPPPAMSGGSSFGAAAAYARGTAANLSATPEFGGRAPRR